MTELQYTVPAVSAEWAASRETHMAVATAIHAIAGPGRSADDIWQDPTPAEWDQVVMAVENYIDCGKFPASDDNRYCWGEETLQIPAPERSTAFDYAGSIQRAAEIVTEGTAFATPEQLAGQYAFDAASQAGYGYEDANLAAHLDALSDAGAKFNAGRALIYAQRFASFAG